MSNETKAADAAARAAKTKAEREARLAKALRDLGELAS